MSSAAATPPRRHACDQCDSSYLRAEHLTRHKQTAHPPPGTDVRRFRCTHPDCDRAYARHDLLNRHAATHRRNKPSTVAQLQSRKSSEPSSSSSSSFVPQKRSLVHSYDDHSAIPSPRRRYDSYDASDDLLHEAHPHFHDGAWRPIPTDTYGYDPRQSEPHRLSYSTSHTAYPSPSDNHPHHHPHPPPFSTLHEASRHSLMHHPLPIVSPDLPPAHAGDSSSLNGHGGTAYLPTPSSGGGGAPHDHNISSSSSSLTNDDLQLWLASMESHSNNPSVPATANERGGDAARNQLSVNDPGGLGWMFEANDLTGFLPAPTAFGWMDVGTSGGTLFGGTGAPLAAIPHPPPQQAPVKTEPRRSPSASPTIARVPEVIDAPAEATTANAASTAWPQDYQPGASSPSRTVDLLTIRYCHRAQHQVMRAMNVPSVTPTEPHLRHLGVGNGVMYHLTIEEEDVPFDASQQTSPSSSSAAHSSSGLGTWPNVMIDRDGRTSARLHVSEEVRQEMLTAIRSACALPWSSYRLGPDDDEFLTTHELRNLLTLFVRKLHPRLPFLHIPTIDPTTAPIFLLIIMVATALMHVVDIPGIEPSGARRLSLALGELARLGIVSLVEKDRRGFLQLANTQCWLLQTMLALSGGDKHMYQLAERNRGGIVTFARRLGLFQARHAYSLADMVLAISKGCREAGSQAAEKALLEQTWLGWVREELRVRLGWSVYVYDQEYCVLLDIAPMLLPVEMTLSLPCSERLWSARSAHDWLQMAKHLVHSAKESRAAIAVGSGVISAVSSSNSASDRETLPSFLRLLFRMEQNPKESNHMRDAALMQNIGQVTKFTAKILACTLFRLRWDAIKLNLLLVGADDSMSGGNTRMRDRFSLSSAGSLVDSKVRRTFDGLARAAASTHATRIEHHPVLFDVVILQLACEQYSAAHPQLFAMLRDLAGRHGVRSVTQRQAQSWLKRAYQAHTLQRSIRRVVLAASQVYLLARQTLLQTTTATARFGERPGDRDGNPSPFQTSGSASVIAIVILFDAALALHAYSQYGTMSATQHDEDDGMMDDSGAPEEDDEEPPFLSRSLTDSIFRTGEMEVQRAGSDAHSSTTAATTAALNQAWIMGEYTDESGSVCAFPPCTTLRIADLKLRPPSRQTASMTAEPTGNALIGVVELLARFHWGLAALFGEVLMRLAHADLQGREGVSKMEG